MVFGRFALVYFWEGRGSKRHDTRRISGFGMGLGRKGNMDMGTIMNLQMRDDRSTRADFVLRCCRGKPDN